MWNVILRGTYLTFLILHIFANVALARNSAQADKTVMVVEVDGVVGPVMFNFIERAVEEANAQNVEALVIQLDTPGGFVDTTRQIIQVIIGSDVPVIVYVSPRGAFAASAGTFITLAGHAAAMAPNTTIGAASPINSDGSDINETAQAKAENILLADIRGLVERRGEVAVEWAEEAITEAKAATAEEALEMGIIDFIAQDLDELLLQLDGFTVEVGSETIELSTRDAQVEVFDETLIEELLSVLANPTIAFMLISIGGLAITYEIINPGGYIGGIIGVTLLLFGFYGVGQLPFNYFGIFLIVLGIGLFVAEVFTPTFGIFSAGGVIALIIGGLVLFNTTEFTYQLPLPTLIGVPVTLALIFLFGAGKAIQARNIEVVTGSEGLIGSTGLVKVSLNPEGTVLVWGERWQAMSEDGEEIAEGERVEVTARDGFVLRVKRAVRNWT